MVDYDYEVGNEEQDNYEITAEDSGAEGSDNFQQDSVSIIPKGKEKRDAFYQQLNNYINLGFEIEAAKEAQKGILERLFEAKDVDVKKGEHNKRIKKLVAQHLADKARQEEALAEDTIADWEIAKKHLV